MQCILFFSRNVQYIFKIYICRRHEVRIGEESRRVYLPLKSLFEIVSFTRSLITTSHTTGEYATTRQTTGTCWTNRVKCLFTLNRLSTAYEVNSLKLSH